MGLFSEMLDEKRIKDGFKDSGHVLMITCPGCACESLSYTEGLPCRALESGKDMEESAVAVQRVRDQWDRVLKEDGKKVTHISVAFPCEMFYTERERILEKLQDADTIALLCCSSGYVAVKDMLPDFLGRFVPMMKTTGTFVFKLVLDESGKNSKVEQETARVIKFSKVNQG